MIYITNNEELIKKNIAEKDRVKLEYKQRLNNIKQYYGVEFNVEHLKDNSVNNINFVNLKYKDDFNIMELSYDNKIKKLDCISYEYSDSRLVKGMNHKKLFSNLDKQYKLLLIVSEINKANEKYRFELSEIDKNYSIENTDNLELEKSIKINKNEEN